MVPTEGEPPDWQDPPEEEIPPALQKRWNDYVRKGVRAGVCRSCGQLFTQDDLSCRHCGEPTEVRPGLIGGFAGWLGGTAWGLTAFFVVLIAVAAYFFLAY
ncbi:MAG TPA: hypothetical protein VL404_05260 [Candidatus Eisenbacteria bacterium]|jgi:hypothetical protein|nr:hypothetical protein [Candidatus Eisenbacteria bacterium]